LLDHLIAEFGHERYVAGYTAGTTALTQTQWIWVGVGTGAAVAVATPVLANQYDWFEGNAHHVSP